jgi:hypothetical protein
MSVPSMRAELLDRMDWLFPEKTWPKRIAARDVAAFVVKNLPESAIHRLPTADQGGAFRALHLAETINRRTRR